MLVAVSQVAGGDVLSENPVEAIDALPTAPMPAFERQWPVIRAGGEIGAEGDVLNANKVNHVLEVADVILDPGFFGRILVPAHRSIDAGADYPARLRHRLYDVVALVSLQIGKCAGIGVRHENGLRGDFNGAKHGTLPDVRQIDGNADLIHYLNCIAPKQREACLLRLETAVAKSVPKVVGELHDPKSEPPKKI